MSNDPTPAVHRAADVIFRADTTDAVCDGWVPQAREALAAALDVEEMAQELHRLFGLNMPWVNLTQAEKAYYRDKATGLHAALLGLEASA